MLQKGTAHFEGTHHRCAIYFHKHVPGKLQVYVEKIQALKRRLRRREVDVRRRIPLDRVSSVLPEPHALTYGKHIQMTAPVSPGSSGGPVINEYGEVVGVTTLASFLFAQNLNFAIPINNLQKLITEK